MRKRCAKQRLSLHSQRNGIGCCCNSSSRAFSAIARSPRGKRPLSAPGRNPPFAPVSERMPIPITSNLARRDRSADNAFVGEREKRLARNETLYREANERVAEVAAQLLEGETDAPGGFICECDAADCTELIPLTLAEYEAIRAVPIRFAVAPGHELPEIETVVERHSAYLVVEKRDDEAQDVARETDPRA